MRFYNLSEARVRRVLHSPRRVEEGIAPRTIAAMQAVSTKTKNGELIWNQEIWVMAQDEKKRRKIISAWRYPGMTRPRSELTTTFLKTEYNEYTASDKA